MQPVGHALATEMRQVARSSIRADIMNVGHFGTADALIDPADDIAQNPLRVVLHLTLVPALGFPVAGRWRAAGSAESHPACARGPPAASFALARALTFTCDGNAVACSVAAVGEGTQAQLGPGLRMIAIFCASISPPSGPGHGPHAFADLRAPLHSPQASPISTFRSSYALIQALAFHLTLGRPSGLLPWRCESHPPCDPESRC